MKDEKLNLDELVGWGDLVTDEEKEIQRMVRRFVQEEAQPHIAADFEAGVFRKELIPQLAELGLLGANLHGYGCAGISSVGYGLACQELEACDSGLRSFVSVQTSLAMFAIWRWGTEAQKNKWLPDMAAGKLVGAFGLTEPNHGSDPSSMKTRAVKDGDHWVISGEKMWITNAQVSDLSVVWAQTSDDARGVRGFVVERGTPGFEATDVGNKLSMRASVTGGLSLDEVRVPDANLLPEAVGMRGPLSCLTNARFGVAFGALGAARACLEGAVDYACERQQYGVPIASKQLIQAQLAEMASQWVSAALLSVHYGRLKDEKAIKPVQISLLKRNNCRMALDAARKARSILGANGITGEYDVLRHALNLESTSTYEGTHEIHSLILGHALTGHRAF